MSEPVDISSGPGLNVTRVPGFTEKRLRPAGIVCALGGDPGGVTGLFLGAWRQGQAKPPVLARAWQCDAGSAPELLEWILEAHGHLIMAAGIEAYDARRKARGMTSRAMYELVTVLTGIMTRAGITVTARTPAMVKPWASEKRLVAAGIAPVLGKMTDDARDAGRHCLYTAVQDCGLRDPLSRVRAR
jgi:hypothetical protein